MELSSKALLENSLGSLCWKPLLGTPLLGTSLGKLSWKPLGNLSWDSLLEIFLGNLSWESLLEISLGSISCEYFLESSLGELYWKSLLAISLRICFLEMSLEKLCWEISRTLSCLLYFLFNKNNVIPVKSAIIFLFSPTDHSLKICNGSTLGTSL